MKKTIWLFGCIGGIILVFGILLSAVYYKHFEDNAMYFGYAMMLLAFSLIFVGVRSYRDNYNNGIISFGKAFKIGLLIALVASTFYVVAWLIDYYFFIPDFMDKYAAHSIEKLKATGASAAEITKATASMDSLKTMYKNPLVVILFTYLEPLPVALIISLICALILKRKAKVAVA